MNIKDLAASLTDDQFEELCAHRYIAVALDSWDNMSDEDRAEYEDKYAFITDMAGYAATQGQFDNVDICQRINRLCLSPAYHEVITGG